MAIRSERFEIRVDAGGNVLLKDHKTQKAYRAGYSETGRKRAVEMIDELCPRIGGHLDGGCCCETDTCDG